MLRLRLRGRVRRGLQQILVRLLSISRFRLARLRLYRRGLRRTRLLLPALFRRTRLLNQALLLRLLLPLQLAGATPFGLGDYILIPNVREALKGDLKDIKAYVLGDEPKAFDLYMAPLTDDERQILADGCLINFYKH